MLFSATSTKKTEDLIKVALKKEPIYIGLEDQNQDGAATVMGLAQMILQSGLPIRLRVLVAAVENVNERHNTPLKVTDPNSWGVPNISLAGSTALMSV